MWKKRGVSPIVATVMIILITISVVVIVATIMIPMIRDTLIGSTACLAVLQTISIDSSSGYSCYDSGRGIVSIKVSRSIVEQAGQQEKVELSGLLLSVGTGETETAYIVREDDSLILVLPFDEGDGTVAYDFSGNAHHGTIHDAEWTESGCHYGSCLKFDGLNSYVDLGHINELNNADELTIEVWIKPSEVQNSNYNYNDIVKAEFLFALSLTNDLKLHANVGNGTDWYGGVNSEFSVPFGQSVYVAVVIDSDGNAKLYINGNPAGSSFLGKPGSNTKPLSIGATLSQDTVSQAYNGTIDEVRIYTRALSQQEIKQHAQSSGTKSKEIFAKLPGEGEARTYKVSTDKGLSSVSVRIAPIIKVGNREKKCDATAAVVLPPCS